MKRILLTSGMILCVSIPSYATGSGFTQSESTATGNALTVSNACVEPRLGVYEGPTTLNAVWNPNTINITWDDNGATTAHTGGDTSCVYDDSVTLPTAPQRIGFIFRGWGVGTSGFDLSTLDASIEGTDRGYVSADGGGTLNPAALNPAAYGLTTSDLGKWGTLFPYGKVIGESICSSTSGENHQSGTPDESGTGDTKYCWCKATGYVAGDTNSSTLTGNVQPVSSASWVFSHEDESSDVCANFCADVCGYIVQIYSDFRAPVFGVSGN